MSLSLFFERFVCSSRSCAYWLTFSFFWFCVLIFVYIFQSTVVVLVSMSIPSVLSFYVCPPVWVKLLFVYFLVHFKGLLSFSVVSPCFRYGCSFLFYSVSLFSSVLLCPSPCVLVLINFTCVSFPTSLHSALSIKWSYALLCSCWVSCFYPSCFSQFSKFRSCFFLPFLFPLPAIDFFWI